MGRSRAGQGRENTSKRGEAPEERRQEGPMEGPLPGAFQVTDRNWMTFYNDAEATEEFSEEE